MPLVATKGAASAQGFGEFAQAAPAANYIEDVFSTYLYTGTSAPQTITNNIDLASKGGLVWIKNRLNATNFNHVLQDSVRGFTTGKKLASNLTTAQGGTNITDDFGYVSGATSTGFTLNQSGTGPYDWLQTNGSANDYVSWTFAEQPKFFDIVTYTGNGANRTIAHNLGSVPGSIWVKRTDTTGAWQCYHRSLANTEYLVLNSFAAKATGATRWNSTTPTSTEFSLGTDSTVNANTGTYVAYLFAHDAGGFGTAGTDNVISCGSYTGNGSATGPVITLGYEPQWLLIKNATTGGDGYDWRLIDNMRGFALTSGAKLLANTSDSETFTTTSGAIPLATGFQINANEGSINNNGDTIIYIAIRRGPMKTPTAGTEVLGLSARSGTGANATVTGSAGVSDAVLVKNRGAAVASLFSSRLTGTGYLVTSTDAAEVAAATTILQANPWDVMDGVKVGTTSTITNATSNTYINYLFSRAPGFFDVVCYTGTGSNQNITHNLGVAPELVIVKSRSSNPGAQWVVWDQTLNSSTGYLYLNGTLAGSNFAGVWNGAPTSTYFTLGTNYQNNGSGVTFVAYLFATVAGVSKVGSYTGTGTTQTINCGFTAGARFVMIKRTDSTGDWYVWDSARGINPGNDPYLLLNDTAAEVTNTDYVDTASSGFEISSTAPAAINANGGSFIFLAIA